ncbi:MAG: hypothetical protein OM95_01675 [Bdellovibrio sp. ArHS]|uniref:hypothetical protein n=1 Tax=Bdellovibrio sp. ArHS TaxID=1569284 RepID=UPI0005831F70|nr:hypothetical protein [Bdellovibrio sp. ArHS]KHD89804.1 MAG: hypothetical protein OM95_01675 [Bdellovibrio sp. ArHS]
MRTMTAVLSLVLVSSTAFAGELKDISVSDFVKVSKLMQETQWSKNETIDTLIKTGENSFYSVVKADGECTSASISELNKGTLYVVPSSVEKVNCSK